MDVRVFQVLNGAITNNFFIVKVELDQIPQPFQETDKFSDYNPGLTLWKVLTYKLNNTH